MSWHPIALSGNISQKLPSAELDPWLVTILLTLVSICARQSQNFPSHVNYREFLANSRNLFLRGLSAAPGISACVSHVLHPNPKNISGCVNNSGLKWLHAAMAAGCPANKATPPDRQIGWRGSDRVRVLYLSCIGSIRIRQEELVPLKIEQA
ncbi:hypothetical protein [Falsirhodobacter xinxiangensis]|uniref:hypothetical protein n=1 Tax=Falsirhodobacter xinxiangensis TaxID=2530049 RepID=UPI0010AA871E|nr:hypothetical protein [Rhodobacter xinxiangensis]